MSAFADSIELRLAVAEHVGRRDLTDMMPRFIRAAESFLNKKLRLREQIKSATLTFTNGTSSLPTDFIEVVTLWNTDGKSYPFGNTKQWVRNTGDGYALEGNSIFINANTSGTREFDYYATLPTLSTSPTSSNFLLLKAPNLYLYAVSLEAAKWAKEIELASATAVLLEEELREINRNDYREKWGNAVVRPAMVVP